MVQCCLLATHCASLHSCMPLSTIWCCQKALCRHVEACNSNMVAVDKPKEEHIEIETNPA